MKTAIIYDKWLSGMGGGEVVACNMAAILRDDRYHVIFVSNEAVSPKEIKNKLGIDMNGVEFADRLPLPNHKQPDLFINISFMDYSYGIGEKNIYYVHFPSKIRSGLFNYVLVMLRYLNKHLPSIFHLLPPKICERVNDRLRAGIFTDMQKRLDSYDTFITHSKYVANWTKKYWGKNAQVLYPPVNLIDSRLRGNDSELSSSGLTRGSKNNWICSVGRFFTLGHGKKQEVMIDAFKKLYDSHRTSEVEEADVTSAGKTSEVNCDLELHLVGGVGNEPSSLRYIKQLQEQAKGYPIHFHFNINRHEVEEILRKSKIYWHSAGYGEDAELDPIKFEHFGIAPIEAISAGCIPILFNGGGLVEIIETLDYDKKLHLFSTVDDLVYKTKSILMNHNEIVIDSKILSTNFSLFSFKERFTKIICD